MIKFATTDYSKCSKCDKEKPLAHFTKVKASSNGRGCVCKVCRNSGLRKVYTKSSQLESTKIKRVRYHTTVEGRIGYLYRAAKQRCKKNGNLFNISKSDIETLFKNQSGLCNLSGSLFVFEEPTSKGIVKDSMSLDRIDSLKGYELGNIQLVTSQVNYAKSYFSQEDFISMAQAVAKKGNL